MRKTRKPKVAQPNPDMLELGIPRRVIPFVRTALRGTWSVADTNSRDEHLSPEARQHHEDVRDMLADLLGKLG